LSATNKEAKGKARPDRVSNIKKRPGKSSAHVGDALRTVYQQAVDEEIPKEFLDILGKLA